MNYLLPIIVVYNTILNGVVCEKCNVNCPPGQGKMLCGLDLKKKEYYMFPSKCAMEAHINCNNVQLIKTPLTFCIKNQVVRTRRMHGESCPSFCPNHYRPVCGMSKIRSYIYKTFNNGCYFDMLNCRGDDLNGYVEVPLSFCQRHLMKNIFKEKVVVSGFQDYRDYHDY